MNLSPRFVLAALLAVACAACSNSSSAPPAGSGGPVTGPADMHCVGVKPQPTNQASCDVTSVDGGALPSDGGSDYGATMDNQEGDDDDCKYHVSWTSTPIGENEDVTFTMKGTYLTVGEPNPPACTGCPIQGLNTSNLYLEQGFDADPMHPPPNTNQVVTETSEGTYTVGPVQFDKAGTWTVRFHLFAICADVADDSPHGHAAFYIHVP